MNNFNIKNYDNLLTNNSPKILSTSNLLLNNDIIDDTISNKANSVKSSNSDSSKMSELLKDIKRTESEDFTVNTLNINKPTIKIDTNENKPSYILPSPIIKYNKQPNNKRAYISDNIFPNDKITLEASSPILETFERVSSFENIDKKFINDDNNFIDENDKQDALINKINMAKGKLEKTLFMLGVKYDKICYKYNTISLTIMILSTISTFIEAVRLTMTEYIKNNKENLNIDIDAFTLSINIFMLVLGTVITILSSIVRFKNYRETMEKLKNYQNTIVKYKILYDKQIDIIKTFKLNNKELDDETFKELNIKLKDYNKEVNENINLLEDIRNDDIIKLQQFKHIFDIKIEKMKQRKNLKILENKNKTAIKEKILNDKKEVALLKIINDKKKKVNSIIYDNNIDINKYYNKIDFSETNSKKTSKSQKNSIITMEDFDIVSTV
jgi:hypothetical protein